MQAAAEAEGPHQGGVGVGGALKQGVGHCSSGWGIAAVGGGLGGEQEESTAFLSPGMASRGTAQRRGTS